MMAALCGLIVGLCCGIVNLRLLAGAARRLTASQRDRPFVISSLFRVGAFAIVAVVIAALGSWPALALYIVGLFVPIAVHAAAADRER